MKKLGDKLGNSSTSQKCYWKIVNRVMNKCKAPKIPPLLVNDKFIVNCQEKANEFIEYFSMQCKPLQTSSTLPTLNYLTENRLDNIPFTTDDILSLLRSLNVNKATGSNGISAKMLFICDDTVILPLKIIFENILSSGTYPNLWKLANIIPIQKKSSKQVVSNYRPVSLLPICGKLFKKWCLSISITSSSVIT